MLLTPWTRTLTENSESRAVSSVLAVATVCACVRACVRVCVCVCVCVCDTPSIAFWHLSPNSARFSYATEGALFISAQLSSDAVSALRKVRVLIKPVLNWANVCSPNIIRTLRPTMIRFLIELLVRRIWFGQSKLHS